MKYIIVFLLILTFSAKSKAQTYLYAADRSEYQLYVSYCNDSMYVDIIQYGKINIPTQNVPGLDWEMCKMIPGNFTDQTIKSDTIWFEAWKPGRRATKYSIDYNQARVERIIKVKVPRRIPSVKDFYLNWKTGKIVR